MVDTVGNRAAGTVTGQRRAIGRIRPGRAPGPAAAGAFIRRHRLAPYLLVLPALAAIALALIWPTLQIGLYSLQNFGEAQIVGTLPAKWVGFSNFTTTLSDPEFWLSLRTTVIFAAVLVTLTMIVGTLVGLLLNRLGRRMAAFVSGAALCAWATPYVSASVIFVWFFQPGRRHRQLGARTAAALAGRRRALGAVQLGHGGRFPPTRWPRSSRSGSRSRSSRSPCSPG